MLNEPEKGKNSGDPSGDPSAQRSHSMEKKSTDLTSFLACTKGGALAEFAIVAPFVILLLFGTINIGFMMFIMNALEAGVREASRYGVTGQTQSGSNRADSIKSVLFNSLTTYSGGIINTSLVTITVKAYSDLASIGQPEPFVDAAGTGKYVVGDPFTDINKNGVWDADQGAVGSFGLSGQAVLYKVSYPWDTLFPIFGTNSKIVLSAQTPIINESF